MKIVFDMDNTLFDELGKEVRPGMAALVGRLAADGHELVLWTSSTRARAIGLLKAHGFERRFASALFREDYDPDNKGAIKDIGRIGADAIIDDDPKHVDHATRQGRIGIRISTYRGGGARADELEAIYKQLSAPQGIFGRIGGALGLK